MKELLKCGRCGAPGFPEQQRCPCGAGASWQTRWTVPEPDPRAALEQIVHLLSEAHCNLAHYSYRDLVELTCRLERIASDALHPNPEQS